MYKISIADLVFKAELFRNKIVRKCTPTSGAIYLHKSLIGKSFDVILIPSKNEVQKSKKGEVSIKKSQINKMMNKLSEDPEILKLVKEKLQNARRNN